MLAAMTLLFLVRHGLTADTGKRLTGWKPGIHLSDRGREQAEQVADRLARARLRAIYASPIERCLETAAPLARLTRLPVGTLQELGEVRYGRWTDRPIKQLVRTRLWRVVQQTPSHVRFPDGESLREVQVRAVDAIERIVGAHPRARVAVVTHADVIRLLLAHFAGVHLDLFQRLMVDPASISIVAAGEGTPRIVRVNDTGPIDDPDPRPMHEREVRG
jgi:probable phosphoglycerate mutase